MKLQEYRASTVSKAKVLRTSTLLALSVVLFSCTKVDTGKIDFKASLDSLKQKYAPDVRTAVYDLAAETIAGKTVLRGDVDDQNAKDRSLDAIGRLCGEKVLDSVRVLPDPQLGDDKFGIIICSVANLRTKPGNPYELCTQALMGTVVKVLKKQGSWYFVQLPDKYLGWTEESYMKLVSQEGIESWKSVDKAIVTTQFALVREQPKQTAQPVSDAVAGVLLRLVSRDRGWVEVLTPDGRRGYIENASVEEFQKWKQSRKLTPDNIEKTAKLFVGVPYLWGGTSTKGMDCSGFTKTVFRLNGLELSRDADQQAAMGEPVEPGANFDNLKKGDLLFFGRKGTTDKPERITHVGIYLAHREFIHSPGGSGVKFNSFDPSAGNYSESLRNRFVRARRVIGVGQVPEVAKN